MFSYVVNDYALIDAGSALGNNWPLLIKKPEKLLNPESLIAIQGNIQLRICYLHTPS